MRYLVTAYYSEWVEATSEEDAENTLALRIARVNVDDFTYEVHDTDEVTQ